MSSSLLQVLMPVRNGARYLPATLDSLAGQTFRDFRLIACDDGSTDATGEILRSERRFPVDVFRNEQAPGIASSANQLIERALATGSPFFARIDADDLCLPERFARQIEFLRRTPEVDIVGSALRFIDANGDITGSLQYPEHDEDIRFAMLFEDPLANPSLMFRAGVFGAPDARHDPSYDYAEDYELWCRLARTARFANLPEVLIHYRRHPGSVSVSRLETQRERARRAQANYLVAQGWPEPVALAVRRVLGLDDSDPSNLPARVRDLRLARACWKRVFPNAVRRPPGSTRVENLTNALFARLAWPQRVGWTLRDPSLLRLYLGNRLART